MQPYTVSENDWISSVPKTPAGSLDIVALEAAARREQARLIAALFARLANVWRHRRQAKAVQRELDRAALGMGR